MIHIWDLFNFIPILGIYNNINGNHYLGFSHHGFDMIHIWDLSLIIPILGIYNNISSKRFPHHKIGI